MVITYIIKKQTSERIGNKTPHSLLKRAALYEVACTREAFSSDLNRNKDSSFILSRFHQMNI
jgi:hypothetical protein